MRETQELRKRPQTAGNYEKIYQQMITLWENLDYAEVAIEYDRFVQDNPAWTNLLNQGPCITYIGDIRTQQYCFISQNSQAILGYEPGLFLQNGLLFLNSIVHPDDCARSWNL